MARHAEPYLNLRLALGIPWRRYRKRQDHDARFYGALGSDREGYPRIYRYGSLEFPGESPRLPGINHKPKNAS
jgi:hypothetical protein